MCPIINQQTIISQYASYSLIFSPLYRVTNGEQHKKHLYSQSSHTGKYGMFDRQSAPSYWSNGCVTWSQCTTNFISSYFKQFRQHYKQRIAPTSSAFTKSRTEAILCVPQIVTYTVEPWCKHWSCCGRRKDKSWDEATLINEKNQACRCNHYRVMLVWRH